MREFKQSSCIQEELNCKIKIFEEIVAQKEDVFEVARKDRDKLTLESNQEFAYGEIIPVYLIPYVDHIKPQPGEIFYDLGCGAGKPVITASIAFPMLKVCKGIE